jgi:Uri superfamily endonuclease
LKGIYVLIITIKNEISPTIGALGKMKFKPGLYAYVGSAQSNLEQRIKRHLRKNKRLFWHIDYLLNDNATAISKVFVKNAVRTEECAVADILRTESESVERFGSSDCSCKSHLFRIKDHEFLSDYMHIFYPETE